MNTVRRAFGVFAFLLLVARPGHAYDPIKWSSVDGGGTARATSGNYALAGTIGQADAGIMSGGTFGVRGGFWLGPALLLPPVIVINDRREFEGSAGTTSAVFTVSLSHAAASPVTVDFATADGTAKVSDNDYAPTSGTVTFDPGQTSRPIPVNLTGDLTMEADETFTVNLSNPAGGGGATIVDAVGAGTILDEDGASAICDGLFVTDGNVKTIKTSNGILYVGGTFKYAGPMTGYGVPVDATSGAPVDGFPFVDGSVTDVLPDGSGGWFIAGFFRSVGGTQRLNLAHILSDNTVAAWDPNPNGTVSSLALSGGLLYVGGSFTWIGGEMRNRIAAIDPATGQATAWNPDANGSIECLAPNGSAIFVGGTFTTIGGQARTRLAALDASTGSALAWNPNANSIVTTMAVSGSTVYIGGEFTNVAGMTRNRIAALDATSGAATAWDPNSAGRVNTLVVDGGTVYAGGSFQTIGGQTRRYIAGLSAATGLATAWNPDADNEVTSLLLSGTKLYATGRFFQIGLHLRRYLAALDTSSGVATPWNPNPIESANAVAAAGSTVYVGGSLTSLGGQTRNNLAAFDMATGALTSWNPDVQGTNATVEDLIVAGNTVYVGGSFSEISLVSAFNIAALDATTGLPLISWYSSTNNPVQSMALSGGILYVGGAFTFFSGEAPNYLMALDATTGAVTSWDPQVTGISSANIQAIVVDGSTVYVAGIFSNMGGQPRSNIAALDAVTAAATSWNPGCPSIVRALAVSGGTIYAGGDFAFIGGQTRRGLAALDAATGFATSWNPNVLISVRALALGNGVVHAGGQILQVSGQPRSGLAAVDTQTGLPTTWDPRTNGGGDVDAILLTGGSIYAGGDFTRIAGQPRSGIVCLATDAVSAAPSGDMTSGFQLTVSPALHEAVRISYSLPEPGQARISIFDVQGRLMARPVDQVRPAGMNEFVWSSRDDGGRVASGLYFVRLDAAGQMATRRFVLLR